MLLTALIYLYGKVCGFAKLLCALRLAVFGAIGIELGLIKVDFRLIWAYFGGLGGAEIIIWAQGRRAIFCA